MNARLPLAALILFAMSSLAALRADDEDPIGEQLLKDKEAHVATLVKAREDVLKGFDKYYEAVKNDKSLKVAPQLAQLEKIEAEKKAFEEDGVSPTLPGLRVAMSEYRTTLKRSETQCKQAFDKAAKAYRDKGDVKSAGAVLEEMKEFLAKAPGAGAAGGASAASVIACGVSDKVWGIDNEGKVVTAAYVKGDQSQMWKIVPAGNGWSYIENAKTGMVVTAIGKGNGADAHLTKKAAQVSDDQLWKVTALPAVKDAVKFIGKTSGKCLGVDGKSRDAGARIRTWTDQGAEPAQYFGFAAPK